MTGRVARWFFAGVWWAVSAVFAGWSVLVWVFDAGVASGVLVWGAAFAGIVGAMFWQLAAPAPARVVGTTVRGKRFVNGKGDRHENHA